MDLLFQGGALLSDGLEMQVDVGVTHGKISHIGTSLAPDSDTEVIPAAGLYLLPGAVELLLELDDITDDAAEERMPWVTGMAAMGGVTSLALATQFPAQGALGDWVLARGASLAPHSYCDFLFHARVSSWSEEIRRQLRALAPAGQPSVWVAPLEGSPLRHEALLWNVARETGDLALVIAPLWESELIRALGGAPSEPPTGAKAEALAELPSGDQFPPWLEADLFDRLNAIAQANRARLLLRSISSRLALERYRKAREEGSRTLAAASLAHLTFPVESVAEENGGGAAPCWPPLRGKTDQSLLWYFAEEALAPVVTSSFGLPGRHGFVTRPASAPHPAEAMALFWPLLYTEGVIKGRLSLATLAQAAAADPAKLAGLYPAKGSLLPGADADIVLFNPEVSWTVGGEAPEETEPDGEAAAQRAPAGVFAGRRLQGAVEQVYLRGRKIVERGQMIADPGAGRLIERKLQVK